VLRTNLALNEGPGQGLLLRAREIAGLDEEDKGTVLGLLLEGAQRLPVDAKARQRWKALGDRELAVRERQAATSPVPPEDGASSSTGEQAPEGEAGASEGQVHTGAEH
jgi:Conjugal transfer protein TraD